MKRYKNSLWICAGMIAISTALYITYRCFMIQLLFSSKISLADILCFVMEYYFFPLGVGIVSLISYAKTDFYFSTNIALRCKSKLNLLFYQLREILYITLILMLVLCVTIAIVGAFLSTSFINWSDNSSYYYSLFMQGSNANFFEVLALFILSSFMGLMLIGTVYLLCKWLFRKSIYAFIISTLVALSDLAGLEIFYKKLNIVNYFADGSGYASLIKPSILWILVFSVLLLISFNKEFLHER